MNQQVMICLTCRSFLDAGDRWAYWQLVAPGIVAYDEPIDMEVVLGAAAYWHPAATAGSEWLANGILPALRGFLATHADHRLIFGTDNSMDWGDDGADLAFTWMEVGYQPQPTPRYYAEILGFVRWTDVERQIEDAHRAGSSYPWWWYADGDRQAAQAAFERAVKLHHGQSEATPTD